MKIKSIALTAIVVMVGFAVINNPVAAKDEPQAFVTPGPNKNVIGFTPNPNTLRIPDLFRKQQNEPSCIQSTDNPAEIFCGFNDCRASDWPEVQGDCWIGTAQSRDFGETWTSRLAPGYLLHPNSLGMGFAADAAVSEIPGNSPGLILLAYIAGHRDSNTGVIAVQRYVKSPREDGEPFLPTTAPPTVLATGAEGRFHDKVGTIFIANDDDPQSSTLEEGISVEGLPLPVDINRLDGVHVVAYSVFTGIGRAVKIMTQYSVNGGISYSKPKKVSDELNTVTGVHLAYLPGVGLSLTYRRSGDSNEANAIVQTFSTSLAKRWTKTQTVFEICPHDQQASGIASRIFTFPWGADNGERLWVFSSDKVDPVSGERMAALGQCTQVNGAPPGVFRGVSRIVGMSTIDGKNWYGSVENPDEPFLLDKNLDSNGVALGQQVFPFAQGAKNHVDIAWWDTRDEDATRPLPDGAMSRYTGADLPYIYDYVTNGGTARVHRTANIYMTRITGCKNESNGACTPEQPIDQEGQNLLSPVRVSRYQTAVVGDTLQEVEANLMNLPTHGSGKLAYTGDYGAFATPRFRRMPSGKAIQNSLPEQPGETNFVPNQNAFLAWGDNRNVYFGNAPDPDDPNAQFSYSPPANATPVLQAPGYQAKSDDSSDSAKAPLAGDEAVLKAVGEPDDEPGAGPTADIVVCSADPLQNFSQSRDSNVYGSRVEDKPSLTALTQARPMNATQRMFPLSISYPGNDPLGRNFCLEIANQPPDYDGGRGSGRASFYPLPSRNDSVAGSPVVDFLDVHVPSLGTVARAAFVTSSDVTTRVNVNAYNGTCATPGTLVSSVQLGDGQIFDPLFCETNPNDPACLLSVDENETHNISLVAPGFQAPGFQAPGYQAPVYQAPVYQAPIFQAGGEAAPVLQAPGMQAPGFQAEGEEAPVLQAPSYQAPGFQADTLDANILKSPGMQAPGFQAPSMQAAVAEDNIYYQDLTYLVETNGNVTGTFSADIAVLGLDPETYSVELIAWQPNVHTTTNANCLAVPEADNKIIAAVYLGSPGYQAPGFQASSLDDVSLPVAFPGFQDPYVGAVSFTGKPGEQIALTARVWVTDRLATGIPDPGTPTSKEILDRLHECSTAENPDPSLNCLPQEIKNGAFLLVPFGAAANGCSTVDVENTDPDVDCISAGAEKIEPPDLFAPEFFPEDGGSVAHEADSSDGATVGTPGTIPDGITITDADPDLTVMCTSPTLALGDVTTLFPFGDTDVSCTATDTALNQSMADITISIIDTVDPMITVPADITDVEATGFGGAAVNFLVTAADITNTTIECTINGGTTIVNSGDTFALGTTTVTCTATDQGGNPDTDSFDVTVQDTTPPMLINLPVDFSEEAEGINGGVAYAEVFYVPPTATDLADSNPGVVCAPLPNALFPLGATPVACLATDASANQTSGAFTVTVFDTLLPELQNVPDDITTEATSSSGASVVFAPPIATDLGDSLGVTCDANSGDTFPIDTTPVTCTTEPDGGGNTASASFNITVADTTAPVVDAHDDITVVLDDASGAIVDFVVTASDAVDLSPVVSCSPASGSPFPVGTTSVTCSATDSSGHPSADSSFNVKVEVGMSGLSLKRNVKAGSANPISWAWTNADDIPVNIGSGIQKIEARAGICSSNSNDVLNEDPGSSGYHQSGDDSWQFNWQTDDADGDPLTAGPYCVRVTLLTTMQYMEANTTIK